MIRHLYLPLPALALLCLVFVSASSQPRVWGICSDANGGSLFYQDGNGLAKSLVTDSLCAVGRNAEFLMQASSGYLFGIARSAGQSNEGVVFRINDKGASALRRLPDPLAEGASMVEGKNGYLYGIGRSPSGTNSTLFRIRADGSSFTSRTIGVYAFHGRGGLITTSSGKIIGMSESGGENGNGFIYEVSPDLSAITILYHFEKSTGKRPFGTLEEGPDGLYGLTNTGGSLNYGALFRIQENGTGFTKLHDFTLTNGAYPTGGLVLINGFAYGMTSKGGSNKKGVIFRIKLDGTGYTILHHFTGANGEFPEGDLLFANNQLVGTAKGGQFGSGVMFSIQTNGSNFNVLKHFQNESPRGNLLLVSDTWQPILTLTTPLPGELKAAIHGTYRSITFAESRAYTLEVSEEPSFITSRIISSSAPQFSLGSEFLKYSTQYYARVRGNIWPRHGETTNFTTRAPEDYSFVSQPGDGSVNVPANGLKVTVNAAPGASWYYVQLSTSETFEQVQFSDSSKKENQRTFTFNNLKYNTRYYARGRTNLSPGFSKVTSFVSAPEQKVNVVLTGQTDPSMIAVECSLMPGASSYSVQLSSSANFANAVTRSSVTPGQRGFIFKDLQPASRYYARAKSNISTQFGPVLEFMTDASIGKRRLWALTTKGGDHNSGTIFSFSIDSLTFRKHHDYYHEYGFVALSGNLTQTPSGLAGLSVADGTGGGEVFMFSKNGLQLYETYGPHDGSLMLGSDNYLYILDDWINMFRGGIYKIFSGGDSVNVFDRIIFPFRSDWQGVNPSAQLFEHSDGYLYGCAPLQGGFDHGTLFRLKMDGSAFQVLHSFNGMDGSNPNSKLIMGEDGFLYGVTPNGGTYSQGVVYRLQPDGSNFMVLHNFNGTTGSNPESALLWHNGKLFGTARNGGTHGNGLIFRINPDGTGFLPVIHCDGITSGNPRGELTADVDGSLYGMTSAGGGHNLGVIYRITPALTFEKLFDFSPSTGGAPDGGFIIMEDNFYTNDEPEPLLADAGEQNELLIYPNPFVNTFTAEVTSTDEEPTRIMVRDMTGALLLDVSSEDGIQAQLGGDLRKGIYLLTVRRGSRVSTQRLVKE
jgi:uncharacterized repeat protein (TIGR03803 family)